MSEFVERNSGLIADREDQLLGRITELTARKYDWVGDIVVAQVRGGRGRNKEIIARARAEVQHIQLMLDKLVTR